MGMKTTVEANGQNHAIPIGISKILIPSYLDKPQIITLISDNEIIQDEFNRWAEPIEECILRVLRDRINQKCDQVKIVIFPFDKHIDIDYKIKIRIHDFIPNETDKTVTLSSFWRMTDKNHNIIAKKNSIIVANYQIDQQENKYLNMIAGMEQAIVQLSFDISEAINAIIFKK
jgi:uncharacterized lipoprotein YmbA